MHEIPREEWASFLYGFGRDHQGWIATVEVLGPSSDAQVEMRQLLLQEITLDTTAGAAAMISIVVGDTPQEHLVHPIPAPSRVWDEPIEEGALEAIKIESASGVTTVVRFRSPLRPAGAGED